MNAYERLTDALRDAGSTVKDTGHGKFMAQCPAHADRNASLSVTAIDGQALVYCHAGCDTAQVLDSIGWTMADLFDNRRDTTYRYPGGRMVRRTPGKSFPQSGNKADRSLFRADRIGDAEHVLVVEGEKDVLAAEAVGAVAVCSAMGAGKAHLADWAPLHGKRVTIVADNDKPGLGHARQVGAAALDVGATSARIVRAAIGKDLADHVAADKTIAELIPVENVEPVAAPAMPRLWNAADLVPATQPRWLAAGRLPRAAVTLLVGDEGIGKSLLWVWLVANITTGKPFPQFGIPAREPAHVIIVVTEDDWADTVLPRLEVAGADLSRIRVICTAEDGSGAPVFPRDLHIIRDADPAPVLVLVDAWLDTVPASMSVKDPQQARQALHPWKETATITDAAVMLLTHTNRVSTSNARDRYGITAELRKVARMTLFAQAGDEDGQLVVGPEKMNTARPLPASVFTIKTVQHFDPTPEHDGAVPYLVYAGESDMTAREHLAENMVPADDDAPNVIGWLSRFLAVGPRWATDVFDAAKAAGISEKKVRTAKRKLAVGADRSSGNGPWYWHLPEHNSGPPDAPTPPSRSSGSSGCLGRSDGSSGQMPSQMPTLPLLESQIPPTTSQDSLMTNGETQGHLGIGDTSAEDLCTVCGYPPPAGYAMHHDCASKTALKLEAM